MFIVLEQTGLNINADRSESRDHTTRFSSVAENFCFENNGLSK